MLTTRPATRRAAEAQGPRVRLCVRLGLWRGPARRLLSRRLSAASPDHAGLLVTRTVYPP